MFLSDHRNMNTSPAKPTAENSNFAKTHDPGQHMHALDAHDISMPNMKESRKDR